MSSRALFFLIASIAVFAAAAVAQTRPAPAQTAPPVKIEAGTQEVVLDIVVRDKKGKLIRDLDPKEFEITEEGAPVKPRSFRLVEGTEEEKKVAKAEAAAQAPEQQQLDPLRQLRLITLVFSNLGPDGKRFLRSATEDLLKMATEPNLFFSLYTIDQTLQLLQPFTNKHELLKQEMERAQTASYTYFSQRSNDAVKQLQTTLSSTPTVDLQQARAAGGLSPAMAQGFVTAKLAQMQLDQMQYAQSLERGYTERAALYALLALVREQSQLPGRKIVIFFTEWFTVSEPYTDLFRAIKSAANRANVAFYTVDAKGLVTYSQNDAGRDAVSGALSSSADQLNAHTGESVRRDQVMAMETADSGLRSNTVTFLTELAKDTGGSIIAETNDLKTPLRKALEEIRTYYEAAYSPDIQTYDGKFRHIAVRLPAHPDYSVHSRSGYFALPPTKAGQPQLLAYEMPLLNALNQTPQPSDVDFRAAAMRFAPKAGNTQVTLGIDVPMRGIEFKADNEKKIALPHASLIAVVKDEKGEVVQKFSQDFPLKVPLEKVDAFKAGNLTQTFRASLAPGKYSLEAGVIDRNSDKAGVKKTPFVVPAPGPLAISSLALIRRVDATPKDADPEDPFIAKEGKIVPEYSRTVQAGPGRQIAFFMVVYTTPGSAATATLNMSIYQGGQLLGGSDLPLPAPDKDGRIQYIASMPADNFPAGEFEMHATAKQGAQTAAEAVPFTVVR